MTSPNGSNAHDHRRGPTGPSVESQLWGWLARSPAALRSWLGGERLEEGLLVPTQSARPSQPVRLGDFTTDGRTVLISLMAIVVGVIGALIAVALMGLIGFITNLVYYGRWWDFKLVSPAQNMLGWWAVLIPVGGGIIIGYMARYGSERIRGHGIPEAIETILVGGSRIEPRLAILKPISSAISIGTGGPFGAEGPIILTGGAFGSVIAQFFKLSAAERKTLLVAGAAAGMAATFNAPVASVLLAVELLVFELKPRSLVPIALASATATVLRRYMISDAPMFPLGPHPSLALNGLLACVLVGVIAGLLAWLLTLGVYGAEDAFRKLPIHWMWWPAIGGVVVGVGGVFFPRALGVGYDTISAELAGRLAVGILVGIIVVKAIIWCVALGSGTSGGILAPILLIGGALGGIEAGFLPGGSPGLWALIAMAATLAGVTRSPLTGVVFALELTYAVNVMLPLLVACMIAHLVTVLILKRSILTEKVARRGFHISCEYAVDPLEVLAVREVMLSSVASIAADVSLATTSRQLSAAGRGQYLYPVVDGVGDLVGVVTRADLISQASDDGRAGKDGRDGRDGKDGKDGKDQRTVGDIMREQVIVAYPDETLRMAAARMVSLGVYRLPVVLRENPRQVVGMVSQRELLRARERLLTEERRRERVFHLRVLAHSEQPPVERRKGTVRAGPDSQPRVGSGEPGASGTTRTPASTGGQAGASHHGQSRLGPDA